MRTLIERFTKRTAPVIFLIAVLGISCGIEFVQPPAAAAAGDVQKAPDTSGPAAAGKSPASSLEGVAIVKADDGTFLNITADGSIAQYKSFVLYNPARIVFDIPKLKSAHTAEQVVPAGTKWIQQVRHYGYPDKVRLVIDTKEDYLKTYTAAPSASGMTIQVGGMPQTAPVAVAKPVPAAGPAEEKPLAAFVSEPQPAAAAAPVAVTEKEAWVNRIDFLTEDAGQSTIIVGTTRAVKYELKESSPQLLQLKLFDTKLPTYRDRPLITTRFESAVDRITPVYGQNLPKTTLVAIELREAVAYDVEQKDDVLMIHFAASSVAPKPLEQANLPDWKKVLAQTEAGSPDVSQAPPQPEPNTSASLAARAAPAVRPPAPSEPVAPMAAVASYKAPNVATYGAHRMYTGEKIALDFYETDIKNVFRIIREISGKNFAIDKDVTGNVTLTLEKPVPWDQVLDLVLKMNRLGMVHEGDIIRIATLSTLTAEEKAKQDKIAAEQKSQEVVKALEPLVTEYIPVNYSDAKGEVMPLAQKVLTPDRGSISVDQRNNQLIVTDTVATIAQIREIVSRIDTVTPQVIIEARVVEVSEEFSMELGIDWNMSWGPAGIFGSSEIGGNVAMNFPSNASSTIGFNFAKLAGTPLTLDATLNAVEANKQGRIITAPKIVTLDNKKASIKQGVEWPYLERDSSGNATVKFKNIDLLLEVTPTVTPDDRILMKIFITKNDIGTITLGVPSLNINEAQTELLVNDSDTIVIGGIIKKNEQESESGWPGVKDIPLMGWLFKTQNDNTTNNELLIFITPRIVQLEQRRVI
ncbi:MAG: type IV pilus secretin PilQ [Desulfobacterales bacterium]